jgi:transcriptional regulator with XRE-family HTH domain
MPDRAVDPRFPDRMRELLEQRGVSYRVLAARIFHAKSYVYDLATGRKSPTPEVAKRIDDALDAGGALAALVRVGPAAAAGDEIDALELGRRVAASDLSAETLQRLEDAVDELASRYSSTPPDLLLPQVRQHLAYVSRLIEVRKTLGQHRRLLVAGGWLSLLGATVHIDLHQRVAGRADLGVARQLAEHADHPEILGWVLETRAWDALTAGRYRRAAELSQQAQAVAPCGSSAYIQATAQEGRAWARIGDAGRTRDALNRTAALASPLTPPDRPEHHYRYDPGKALAYTATTLSWVGDPTAEEYARAVVAELDAPDAVARPRRVASARLDLALALLVAQKPDEASAAALSAVTSGRVVASNWWRVTEVMSGVDRANIPEGDDLRDAYETYRPTASARS